MQNQTLKALSTLTNHTVQHLLMGGQACVLYGAAQFSRDADIAILATSDNLDRLQNSLDELQAEALRHNQRVSQQDLVAQALELAARRFDELFQDRPVLSPTAFRKRWGALVGDHGDLSTGIDDELYGA